MRLSMLRVHNRNILSVVALVEHNLSVGGGKNAVVAGALGIVTREKLCAALLHNDRTGCDQFSRISFYAQMLWI